MGLLNRVFGQDTAGERARTGDQLVLSMVAMPSMEWVDPAALSSACARQTPRGPILRHTDSGENTMSFSLGDQDVILALMPAPIPWADLEQPCAHALMWPEAEETMRSHVAHYVVTLMGPSTPLRSRVQLTRLTAALVSCQPACGVYWGESSLVHKPEMFAKFAEGVTEQKFTSMLWINFILMAGSKPGTASLFTIGMKTFDLMELEVVDTAIPLDELHERACDLATYLITSRQSQLGPIVQNGHTFGWTAEEKFLVRHQSSQFGVPGKVYRIHL